MLIFNNSIRAPFLLFVMFLSVYSYSDQYQSNELINSSAKSVQEVKSIKELEEELQNLSDAYAKDSTARYLARHFSQSNSLKDINKSIEYYQVSLNGNGLSVYAKQVTTLELISLFFRQEMYSEFLNGLSNYLKLGGKPSSRIRVNKVTALYQTKKNKSALDHALELYVEFDKNQVDLELSDLKQLLFTFYNLNDYLNSANVQRSILLVEEDSVEQWLRLSKIYLKNNQPNQAAEVMLSALQKGLAIDEDDLLLMCDLLNQSGNPYSAARLLQQLLDQYHIDHKLETYDRLFKYWYLSQEIGFAASILEKSLQYDNTTSRYLDLSELYYQNQDWTAMNLTIKSACSSAIKDEYVGRANLLLGISELKLQQDKKAIAAFYNATMISGKVKEALAYLNYLNADISNTRRYEQITGVCAPAKVK